MIVTTIYDNTCDGIIGFDIDFKVEWSCKSENLKNRASVLVLMKICFLDIKDFFWQKIIF